MIPNAKISLASFTAGTSIYFISFSWIFGNFFLYLWEDFWPFILILHVIILNGILVLLSWSTNLNYKVAVRGGFLGTCFGLGLLITFSDTSWTYFGWYTMVLSFFHFSEYFTTAVSNSRSLTLDSFLLDHSKEYKIAALASWLEFTIEWYIAPGVKQFHYISLIGLLIVLFGEVLRKSSMLTAKTNFNHYVQYRKQTDHVLVTSGVYAYCRHPAYVGWFYWSIGTQLILCNPICLVGYTLVSWRFFRARIYEEEIYLLNFFGEDYVDYQRRVPTGLPAIRGYDGHV